MEGDKLLRYYRKQWGQWNLAMGKINHILAYLNRHWIKRQSEDGKKDVYEVFVVRRYVLK
tara:strand:- start:2315 stop:2494 length:180 start_codon:yes stop_codon:yes gene_type:complete